MDLSRSTVWNSGIVTDPIRSTVWVSWITTDLSRSTGWVSFTLDQGRSTSIANEYMKRQNRGGGGRQEGGVGETGGRKQETDKPAGVQTGAAGSSRERASSRSSIA